MNRFWNLGLERMLNINSITAESKNFQNDPICEELYPEGCSSDEFKKPKSVTLDLLGECIYPPHDFVDGRVDLKTKDACLSVCVCVCVCMCVCVCVCVCVYVSPNVSKCLKLSRNVS